MIRLLARSILCLLLFFIGCTAANRGKSNLPIGQDTKLVAGTFQLSDLEQNNKRILLGYPSANFEFPEQLYGVYIELTGHLSKQSLERLKDYQKRNSQRVIFVEVLSDYNEGALTGRLVGYGKWPKGIFKHFKTADLSTRNFHPFH